LRGTAGGAVAPLTTQGRLAPVGLVPELALGAPEGVEGTPPRLPPRSRERGTGTDSPTVKSTPSRRLTHQSPCLGLFLYFAWLRGRNLRELPHNQPCHDGEAPEAPTFPARGIAGRSTDYRPPAPRPGRSPTVTSPLFDWSTFSTGRRPALPPTLPTFQGEAALGPLKREPPPSSLPQGKGVGERRSGQGALRPDRPLLLTGWARAKWGFTASRFV
jgi:hypothetical protein